MYGSTFCLLILVETQDALHSLGSFFEKNLLLLEGTSPRSKQVSYVRTSQL
jgi:hypothetical protein